MSITKDSVKVYRDYFLKFKGLHFSLNYDVIDEIITNKNLVVHFSFVFGRRYILTIFENHIEDFSYSHSSEDIQADTYEQYFMKYFGSEMKIDGKNYPHLDIVIPKISLLERFENLHKFLVDCSNSEIRSKETIDLIENICENVKVLLFRYVYREDMSIEAQIRLIYDFVQSTAIELISKYAFNCVNNNAFEIDFSNKKKKTPLDYIEEKRNKIFGKRK